MNDISKIRFLILKIVDFVSQRIAFVKDKKNNLKTIKNRPDPCCVWRNARAKTKNVKLVRQTHKSCPYRTGCASSARVVHLTPELWLRHHNFFYYIFATISIFFVYNCCSFFERFLYCTLCFNTLTYFFLMNSSLPSKLTTHNQRHLYI